MRVHSLFFIRHGETFYNAEGRIQGQLDTPLSPRGRDQARAVGLKLQAALAEDNLKPGDVGWLASPLSRAVETMELARAAMGLPSGGYSRDPRLMEIHFGRWQDLTWPEIRHRDPQLAAERDLDVWNFAPPGGESYAALTERVRQWLVGLAGPAVAVAHGGVARALSTLIGGLAPDEARALAVQQGRILKFEGGKGRWI